MTICYERKIKKLVIIRNVLACVCACACAYARACEREKNEGDRLRKFKEKTNEPFGLRSYLRATTSKNKIWKPQGEAEREHNCLFIGLKRVPISILSRSKFIHYFPSVLFFIRLSSLMALHSSPFFAALTKACLYLFSPNSCPAKHLHTLVR